MYGCRGWTLHHNTDIWRSTGSVDGPGYGIWPTCNSWFCQHLWNHYLFSGNRDYLTEIYPLMRSACEFYLDFLIRDPKNNWLVVSPSYPSDVCRIKHRYFHYRVASLCTIGSLIVWRFRVLAGHWVMMFQRQYSPGNRSYKTLFYPKSVPSFLLLVSLTIWVILRSAIPVKRPFPPSFPKVKGSS